MGTHDKIEALVLTDGEGKLYAIPRETVERYKVSGEQKAEIERELGDEVQGFSFFASQVSATGAGTMAAAMGASPAKPQPEGPDLDKPAPDGPIGDAAAASFAANSLFGSFMSVSRGLLGPGKPISS